MKCPAEIYAASNRPYTGIPEPHYPFHDRTVNVTSCGRICLYRKKINLSKSLANLFASEGILVHCICPGPVWTDSWERTTTRKAKELSISYDEAAKLERAEDEAAIPLNRLGGPQDVASLTVFLASGQASWMTGSCLRVDGGKVRSML